MARPSPSSARTVPVRRRSCAPPVSSRSTAASRRRRASTTASAHRAPTAPRRRRVPGLPVFHRRARERRSAAQRRATNHRSHYCAAQSNAELGEPRWFVSWRAVGPPRRAADASSTVAVARRALAAPTRAPAAQCAGARSQLRRSVRVRHARPVDVAPPIAVISSTVPSSSAARSPTSRRARSGYVADLVGVNLLQAGHAATISISRPAGS